MSEATAGQPGASQPGVIRAGDGAFSPRVVIALLVAGVFAFSAFVVLSTYAPDLRGGSDGGGHALSRSAIGFGGMSELLKGMGEPVVISRDLRTRTASTSLLILTPDVVVNAETLNALTQTGPTLIVMPKWSVAPDPTNAGWVQKAGAIDLDQVVKVLSSKYSGVKMARAAGAAPVTISGLPDGTVVTGPIDQLQTFTDDPDIILRDASGRGILTKSHTEPVYMLSDPDLLNTQGIKNIATARAGVAVLQSLRKGDGPILFDVTMNGFGGSRSVLKLAFQPPFLGATLCLAAAALLMALQALTRFGAPRQADRAIALGKQALADNSAALIRLARREARMAPRYLDLTRASVAKALGASGSAAGRLTDAELDALLDRQAERVGAEHRLAALTTEAREVKDRAGLMRLAEKLYQWKTEMTGERH
jgi:hypothetical protein